MKKFLFVLLIGLISFINTNAQTGSSYTFPTIAGDSLVNADTVFKKISITAGYNSLGIQANIKKGTGTLDGKMYVYTSVNAGTYVLTDSASFTAVPVVVGFTSNSTWTYTAIITKTAPAGTRYIVAVTQAGTLTSSPVSVSYVSRRYD